MLLKLNIGFEQIFSLANQLPSVEKEKLISALQKSMEKSETNKAKRQIGKFRGQISTSDDFNEPLEDFNEYTK